MCVNSENTVILFVSKEHFANVENPSGVVYLYSDIQKKQVSCKTQKMLGHLRIEGKSFGVVGVNNGGIGLKDDAFTRRLQGSSAHSNQ